MQQNNVQNLASFSLNALMHATAQQPAEPQNKTLSKILCLTWSVMTSAQKAVLPLLLEVVLPAGTDLRVPAPTREQWVEVFGEQGENPHLPHTVWQDELQDEDTDEGDYWSWVVASYPSVWGVNCDGAPRPMIGRPLQPALSARLLKQAA